MGGGIYSLGNVTVTNSTFNLAAANGGDGGNAFGTTATINLKHGTLSLNNAKPATPESTRAARTSHRETLRKERAAAFELDQEV